jgi:hypothetical protein
MEIVDWKENEIRIGSRCLFGDTVCIVESISDPDGDYDDNLGRAVMIMPRVYVKFLDGTEDRADTHRITEITWADYPDGPELERFQADDLEVINDDK